MLLALTRPCRSADLVGLRLDKRKYSPEGVNDLYAHRLSEGVKTVIESGCFSFHPFQQTPDYALLLPLGHMGKGLKIVGKAVIIPNSLFRLGHMGKGLKIVGKAAIIPNSLFRSSNHTTLLPPLPSQCMHCMVYKFEKQISSYRKKCPSLNGCHGNTCIPNVTSMHCMVCKFEK